METVLYQLKFNYKNLWWLIGVLIPLILQIIFKFKVQDSKKIVFMIINVVCLVIEMSSASIVMKNVIEYNKLNKSLQQEEY